MAVLTREEILARKLGRRAVDLPDGSGTVVVRALTRNEAIRVGDLKDDIDAKDNLMIHLGLVEPAMSLDDVAAWALADDAGTLSVISEAIAELSNMTKGSAKAVTKSVPRKRR